MPFFYSIYIAVILFVYGTVIGSFLNVVIYRIPQKEDIVKSRSHCMSCKHTLAWYDLFPVLSWVMLKGKCRYCKESISGRYALVESLCGLAFAVAFLTLGLRIELAFALILLPILICLSFYDIDTGEIEYWCPISIAVLGLIMLGLSISGVVDSVWYSHLIGGVIISVPFMVLCFFGAMGGADVQLMAAAGLLLGWSIIPAALIGIFLGAVVGMVIKVKNNPKAQAVYEDDKAPQPKGTVIKFGPFLAIGIAVGFFWGDMLIELYLTIMGIK